MKRSSRLCEQCDAIRHGEDIAHELTCPVLTTDPETGLPRAWGCAECDGDFFPAFPGQAFCRTVCAARYFGLG